MRKISWLATTLALSTTVVTLNLSTPGFGQATNSAAEAEVYRIAPEDTLKIAVADQPDLNRTLLVTPDGKISYPYVGEVTAAGLTPAELTSRLERGLTVEYVHPLVTVSLETRHVRQLSVLGTVKTPGKYDIKEGWRVLDALAAGGGLLAERPEWASATIIRDGVTTIPVDMTRLMAADSSQNVELKPGDVLLVQTADTAHTQVQVLGSVVKTGAVPVPKDGSVAAVIAAVGGPTTDAALSRATILRDGKSIPIDLRPLLASGAAPAGVRLQAGDTVIIPQNRLRFAVLGAVTTPGALEYPDTQPMTLLAALAKAGGQTPDADLGKATLVRPSLDGSNPLLIPIHLDNMLNKGDLAANVIVQPGDILFVPSHSKPNPNFRPGDFISLLGWLHF